MINHQPELRFKYSNFNLYQKYLVDISNQQLYKKAELKN